MNSETESSGSVKPIARRTAFRIGSLTEWINFLLWLFYLFVVWRAHTPYAAFLLITTLLLVGPLHVAWRKEQALTAVKRAFLWVPIPVSALVFAMLATEMTPYVYPPDQRGVSVRVDRWSGCSWVRTAGSSEEWGTPDCPNNDHNWLSEFFHREQTGENQIGSKPASTSMPVSPISPSASEAANSATTNPVDLLVGVFVLTRGSLVDQSRWGRVTIGVDANGELYIVTDGKARKWSPEKETWAPGDPVAWTNARDLVSQRSAVVTAMCRRHIPVWVFDEILRDENGRIAHAATEPACRLLGESNAFAPTSVAPEPQTQVIASVSQRPLENGELVGRSDRVTLTKNVILLERTPVGAGGEDDDGATGRPEFMTVQEWLANESGRVVYFFKSAHIKGQAYEDLSPEQQSLVQDFCHQDLQIYQVSDSDDHPASVCSR